MTMTENLRQRLMEEVGLNKQQASSFTAEALVQYFMSNDGKILMQEARQQVDEMQKLGTIQ